MLLLDWVFFLCFNINGVFMLLWICLVCFNFNTVFMFLRICLLCFNFNSVLMLLWVRLLHIYTQNFIFRWTIVHSFVDKLINLFRVLRLEVNLEMSLGLRLFINIYVKVMLFHSWLLFKINIQVMLCLVRLIF